MSVNVQNKRKREEPQGGPITTLEIKNFGEFKKKRDCIKVLENSGIKDYEQIIKVYRENEVKIIFATEVEAREAVRKIKDAYEDKYRMGVQETRVRKRFKANTKVKTLEEAVSPWYDIPYAQQLKKKLKNVRKMWKKGGKGVQISEIVPSPEVDGYRNTCEFTFGMNKEGKRAIGFLHGSFKSGYVSVEFPEKIRLVSKEMIECLGHIQSFLEKEGQDDLTCYSKLDHTGFLRLVKLRSNAENDMIVMIQIHDGNVTKERLEKFKTDMKDHILNHKFKGLNVKGLYYQCFQGKSNAAPETCPLECVHGGPIQHKLCGKVFQMGPVSFFQVNLKGAELLYKRALEWAQIGSGDDTLLLDVCCGTGTIGIIGAEKVKKVVGLELNIASVEDAKKNAELNGVKNVEYIQGYAEKKIGQVINTHPKDQFKHVVAICDPPRSGLHPSVLSALYLCPQIERIVYVSCNPVTCANDCAILTGFKSTKKIREKKKLTTEHFTIQKVVAVDMFPHTPHCENIVLLER